MATVVSVTDRKAWLKEFYPLVQEICVKNNLLAVDAIVSQAACESNWGQSGLSKKAHNYFGMKCGASWKGDSINMTTQEEYTAGTMTTIKDNFRSYKTMAAGVQGYVDFITKSSRYGNLLGVSDCDTYIRNIKNDGWATSSTYITTLQAFMSHVRKYMLELNGGLVVAAPIIKLGSRGDNVRTLQNNLNTVVNAKLIEDGIAGKATIDVLKQWQAASGITADGVYGNKSYDLMYKQLKEKK